MEKIGAKVRNRVLNPRLLLAGLPLLFLAVFCFYPLIKIFGLSLFSDGNWELERLKELIADDYYAQTMWFTTWQAAVSTILTLILALPGAYIMARYEFRGKGLIRTFSTVPFVLPTVVVAAAFRAFLGPHGLVNEWLMSGFNLSSTPIRMDHTVWFFLLAHIFYNYAVVIRIVGGFWSHIDRKLTEAAQILGASNWQAFRRITLPLLWPAICAAALLIFIFCFCSFGVIIILGGPGFATLEVEIYQQTVHMFNLPVAAALSIIQIVFTFSLMWVFTWLQRKTAVGFSPAGEGMNYRRVKSKREKFLIGTIISFMIMFLGFPLLALMIRSVVSAEGFTFSFYNAILENSSGSIFFVPPVNAVFNSLIFAMAAMSMALVLGTLASVYLAGAKTGISSILDPIFMIPLSTSAVTLGFGFIIALDRPPLNLRTSIMLVPLAHTLVAFPFVVRCIVPALRSIPNILREAAAVLGASPRRVWRTVDLPIIGRAILVGAIFAFAVSLGEFGATVFVARPQTPTIPLAIFRFLSQPGALNYGQAMAMSSILMLITAFGFLLLEKFRIGVIGRF
ncbi:ABC transporter permease [Thermodesulfobacteriota bacterium]